MEKLIEPFLTALLSQGPLLTGAALIVWWLLQERKELQTKLDAANKKIQDDANTCTDEILEERQLRLNEQKEATTKLERANERMSEANRAMRATVKALTTMRGYEEPESNSDSD